MSEIKITPTNKSKSSALPFSPYVAVRLSEEEFKLNLEELPTKDKNKQKENKYFALAYHNTLPEQVKCLRICVDVVPLPSTKVVSYVLADDVTLYNKDCKSVADGYKQMKKYIKKHYKIVPTLGIDIP